LVGGTASVVGEDTSHLDDTQAQLDETLLNLAALVSHAVGSDDDQESLGRFREVRAYYPQDELPAEQVEHLAARMPNATRIDWIQADLCRRNLLVEIEGIAEA
jgi:chorismate lyase/3-hydroxybenzoate synthase